MLAAALCLLLQAPIPVRVAHSPAGFTLLRGGMPYFVKGVGGTEGGLAELPPLGANSFRTWGADQLGADLALAAQHGLTVCAGIWLGHKEHGFDVENPEQRATQTTMVRQVVTAHRDHPSLLIWGLGNEMEIGADTDALWRHVGELAKLVKELDPLHPVMTVVAEVSAEKVARIMKFAPEVDILGVNSYGGLASMPDRLRSYGWSKPYVVTEFGPFGPWERPKTSWGAPYEQTSTEKASKYLRDYKLSIEGKAGWCLGSYAFLYGHKQETTPTWFGMLSPDGQRLGAIDAMSYAWTGKWPEQRAPQILRVTSPVESKEVEPGSAVHARVVAQDPNGDPLRFVWSIRSEVTETGWAGEGEKSPASLATSKSVDNRLRLVAPSEPGPYRVYVEVTDGTGRAALANFPFFVKKG